MLEQGEILTLNNNLEYAVVKTTTIDSRQFVFLINQDDYTDTKICEYNGVTGLTEVVDEELLENLIQKFNS